MRWISVKEYSPIENEEVIVYFKDDGIAFEITHAWYRKGEWIFTSHACCRKEPTKLNNVTYWMRLPTSPTLPMNTECNMGHICKVCFRII